MPSVFAEMDGDAVGTGALGEHGESDRVGFDRATDSGRGLAVTRLADRCTVIDIDAEKQHESGKFDGTKRFMILEGKTK